MLPPEPSDNGQIGRRYDPADIAYGDSQPGDWSMFGEPCEQVYPWGSSRSSPFPFSYVEVTEPHRGTHSLTRVAMILLAAGLIVVLIQVAAAMMPGYLRLGVVIGLAGCSWHFFVKGLPGREAKLFPASSQSVKLTLLDDHSLELILLTIELNQQLMWCHELSGGKPFLADSARDSSRRMTPHEVAWETVGSLEATRHWIADLRYMRDQRWLNDERGKCG